MMAVNLSSPRGVSAYDAAYQMAFKIGAADWRAGRAFRSGDDLPPLEGIKDSIVNRQRIYEIGRLTAAFARAKRRKINAATAQAAKRAGFIP